MPIYEVMQNQYNKSELQIRIFLCIYGFIYIYIYIYIYILSYQYWWKILVIYYDWDSNFMGDCFHLMLTSTADCKHMLVRICYVYSPYSAQDLVEWVEWQTEESEVSGSNARLDSNF